jgi:uncharacterized protein
MRKNITFQSAGTKCSAWYFEPQGEGPFPVLIMAHGLAGTKKMRLDAYAEKFVDAGFACFVFDYRYFGESEGEPRQLLDIKSQHQDWNAAIEFASKLPSVDPNKVILWGSSLSGGHVIEMAATLPKVFAVISQVPHLSGLAALRINGVKKILSLSAHGIYDKLRGLFGFRPHYIPASSEPNALGLMNAPGESKGYLNLVPKNEFFDQRVSARFALDISAYSPIRHLKQLQIPILIQIATQDITTPSEPLMKVRGMGVNVQLKKYNTGHFQPYVEPMFSVFIRDQINFLHEVISNKA